MTYVKPSNAQRAFLDKLIAVSEPGLAVALESQFDGVLVAAEEYCSECFMLKPANRSVRLPRGIGRPVSFEVAEPLGERKALDVLLWHEGGIAESVEISWEGDEHPKLEEIDVEPR